MNEKRGISVKIRLEADFCFYGTSGAPSPTVCASPWVFANRRGASRCARELYALHCYKATSLAK